MEASEAGLAAEGATEAQEGAEGTEEAQQGPDLSPILDRFGELESTFGDRFSEIESRLAEPGQEGDVQYVDDQGNPVDEYGAPLDGDGQPDLDGLNPQDLLERARAEARAEMQQYIAPLQEKFTDMEMDNLEKEFPELSGDAAEPVVEAVKALAQKYGNPSIAQDADVVRMVYLAQKGEESAAQETPAGADSEVALESGGASGLHADEGDDIDKIFAGSSDDGFWR